ncbi:FAD-dependent oxidoreductase [Gorillibacterium sp. sgz500922]|uniref:FAD-dependent oxidoreductase n=1 Tax=Gorillibacterium sp. sgz500922 TaxID=3446694 RepID=UPI003F681C41
MKHITERYDIAVCGGGLAGFCAAVAAARHGASVCLIQDRPVFGGNSSSEVRVTPHGAAAFHPYARETGIISELLIEERALNHEVILENGWTNSVWDMVMYDMAVNTPNLAIRLNTSVQEVEKADDRTIRSVTGIVANGETRIRFEADTFIDCTGDGLVADLAGCEWRMGCEGRDEFGEPHAPLTANNNVMGNSIHFKAKDMGRPVPFHAPDWAIKYDDASFFYNQGRKPYDIRGGYWWLEIGMPWHTIYDAELIRHELTRHTLGVWDWIKNKDPETKELAANYALDWVGQVPGKRESRRVMGQYLMTEHDITQLTVFPDEIAFGGWFLDLHTPGGLLAASSEPEAANDYNAKEGAQKYCGPYGIPYRSCVSKDMDNLLLAGRNISVTHAALGTVRVQGTTALLGQAVGTAAALARKSGLPLAAYGGGTEAETLKQTLLRDGCFLPNAVNGDPADLARSASVSASSEALLFGAEPAEPKPNDPTALVGWGETRPQKPVEPDPHAGWEWDRLRDVKTQWIGLGCGELNTISVCLTNTGDSTETLRVRLMPTEHIWDYRLETGEPIAEGTLEVPPGEKQWIAWSPALTGLAANRYVRLDLLPNEQVIWHSTGTIVPGHPFAYSITEDRLRGGWNTRSFRIDPPQPCYGAAHAVSGATRPHRKTNLWRSDPAQPLPQWLELGWSEPQRIASVELVFPGHLIREYHDYPPFYRDPQCPKDYQIEGWIDGQWTVLHRESGNYQQKRVHALDAAVLASKLRVVITATNGDPAAAVYEIRCYG